MIEIYECDHGETSSWRWRLKGRNGEIVAHGEGYASKDNCIRGIETTVKLLVACVHDFHIDFKEVPH